MNPVIIVDKASMPLQSNTPSIIVEDDALVMSKFQIYTTTISAFIIALLGAFLIVPAYREPSMGLFIWFLSIFVIDLIYIAKVHQKLRLNVLTVGFIISYILITFGFVINSKDHILNIFLLLVLLPIINVGLLSNLFRKHIFSRSLYLFGYWFKSKFIGVFQIGDRLKLIENENAARKELSTKITDILKLILLFLVFGLPVILVVVILLKNSNQEFARWIETVFSLDFSPDTIFARIFFVAFVFPYVIGEFLVLTKLSYIKTQVKSSPAPFAAEYKKYALFILFFTITILNLCYIIFVVAELKYDFNNVRDLLTVKNFDSYSRLAVSRFWDLIIVTLINLGLVYLTLKPLRKHVMTGLFKKFHIANCALLLISTLFLVFSVHQRLSLYEQGYGFTVKRFLAHSFLPIIIAIVILIFIALIYKRYKRIIRIIACTLLIFFAVHIAIPTDYIVNKINLELAKNNKVIIYDPIYTVSMDDVRKTNINRYYSSSVINNTQSDLYSDDGLLTAIELLKGTNVSISQEQRNFLIYHIQEYYQNNKNRDFNEQSFLNMILISEIEKSGVITKK